VYNKYLVPADAGPGISQFVMMYGDKQ